MTKHTTSSRYCAYMLRCWNEGGRSADDTPSWRFSLEDPHTGTRRGFASFVSLIAFLRETLSDDASSGAGARPDEKASP